MHFFAQWVQSPRQRLRIGRVEVSQKFVVREMEQARGVVSHGVGLARDMIVAREVPMMPEKLIPGLLGSGGAFLEPHQGWHIVVESCKRAIADIHTLCQDVSVPNNASKFEVTIGDGTGRVLVADEGLDDVIIERIAP